MEVDETNSSTTDNATLARSLTSPTTPVPKHALWHHKSQPWVTALIIGLLLGVSLTLIIVSWLYGKAKKAALPTFTESCTRTPAVSLEDNPSEIVSQSISEAPMGDSSELLKQPCSSQDAPVSSTK